MEIISFFSFKGGVGRTALLTNLGARWAEAGKTVVLVDMDLAAPGLTFSPLAGNWLDEAGRGLGLSDILAVHHEGLKHQTGNIALLRPSRLLRRMAYPGEGGDSAADSGWDGDGRLLLIDSGSPRYARPCTEEGDGLPANIPAREGRDDLPEAKLALRDLAEAMREDLAAWRHPGTGKSIDYVLIDSRTGFAELVDLSLGFLADRMVLVSGLNPQNLRGLELTLKALCDENRVRLDEFPAKVTVVLSPLPVAEEEATMAALRKAHGAIDSALRTTSSGVREASPQTYHLHYASALAVDDRPLALRQPRSRYAREIRLIANWLDGTPVHPWEIDAVRDDTLHAIDSEFNHGQGWVMLQSHGKPTPADSATARNRPNPAADLPAWHWALAHEQQTPEARRRRLRDLIDVKKLRPGVDLDPDAFLTALAWATPLPLSERQRILTELPRMKPERVAETRGMLDELRRVFIGFAARDPLPALHTVLHGAIAWATWINNKPVTGLRRFLHDPVDGEAVFTAWEAWPDYWLFLTQRLILEFNDVTRALAAIDRAVTASDAETVAARLPDLIAPDHISPKVRTDLVAKARALAPDSRWVDFRIAATERPRDRAALRVTAEPLLAAPPDDATRCQELFDVLANYLPDMARHSEAIVQRATLEDQHSAYSQNLQAIFFTLSDHYEEAETAYRRAIDLDPKESLPWNGLGNLLQDHLHRHEEAEATYRRAIDLDPKYADPWNGLGNLLQGHLDRYEEAEAAYRRAIDLDPNLAFPWNGLGNLLQGHLDRYEEAEAAYRRAIDLDPKNAAPWNGLALLAARHRRCGDALEFFRGGIDLETPPRYLPMNRGLLRGRLAPDETARADLILALDGFREDRTPSGQINRLRLTLILNAAEELPAATAAVRNLATAAKTDFSAVFTLLCHALIETDAWEGQIESVLARLASHGERRDALNTLYDLAGWRPECRERAREAARRLLDLPADVTARFRDHPTPSEQLEVIIRFAQGHSTGAGDPSDRPFLCTDAENRITEPKPTMV